MEKVTEEKAPSTESFERPFPLGGVKDRIIALTELSKQLKELYPDTRARTKEVTDTYNEVRDTIRRIPSLIGVGKDAEAEMAAQHAVAQADALGIDLQRESGASTEQEVTPAAPENAEVAAEAQDAPESMPATVGQTRPEPTFAAETTSDEAVVNEAGATTPQTQSVEQKAESSTPAAESAEAPSSFAKFQRAVDEINQRVNDGHRDNPAAVLNTPYMEVWKQAKSLTSESSAEERSEVLEKLDAAADAVLAEGKTGTETTEGTPSPAAENAVENIEESAREDTPSRSEVSREQESTPAPESTPQPQAEDAAPVKRAATAEANVIKFDGEGNILTPNGKKEALPPDANISFEQSTPPEAANDNVAPEEEGSIDAQERIIVSPAAKGRVREIALDDDELKTMDPKKLEEVIERFLAEQQRAYEENERAEAA